MGQVLFGELELMGFSIVHGPPVMKPLREKITNLANSFRSGWSGLTSQNGRVLVVPPAESANSLLDEENHKFPGKNTFANYLNTIKEICQDVMKSESKISYYKPNIMFNRSPVSSQPVHYDYRIQAIDYEKVMHHRRDGKQTYTQHSKKNTKKRNEGRKNYTDTEEFDHLPLSVIKQVFKAQKNTLDSKNDKDE